MFKNKFQRITMILLLMVFSFSSSALLVSCSSDDDDNDSLQDYSVLFSESSGNYVINLYKKSASADFIILSIPSTQNGKEIDLNKGGDWVIQCSDFVAYEDNLLDKGSTLYIHKTSATTIDIKYNLKYTANGKTTTKKGNYSGKMTIG